MHASPAGERDILPSVFPLTEQLSLMNHSIQTMQLISLLKALWIAHLSIVQADGARLRLKKVYRTKVTNSTALKIESRWLDTNSPPTNQPVKSPSKSPTGQPASVPSEPISPGAPVPTSTKPLVRPPKRFLVITPPPTRPPTKSPTRPPTKSPTIPAPISPPIVSPVLPPGMASPKPPTRMPTKPPTRSPTRQPTKPPIRSPTRQPTKPPTRSPTRQPTKAPTKSPTRQPTKSPTKSPTRQPTKSPSTNAPARSPTSQDAALLFRELRSDAQDGSWGPASVDIPGYDHVALNYFDSVYESHPGYRNGPIYVSGDGKINKTIAVFRGVQNGHNFETFKHNSPNGTTSVVKCTTFPINSTAALAMKNAIATKVGSAGFLGFTTVEELVATHQPEAQKGRDNTFTCCGLIEWAAEQAGINGGQGFIPNELEAIVTVNATYPLLSPQVLYYATQVPSGFVNLTQYIVAYFDPVEYMLTDPLNRRTGIVNRTRISEIPNALVTPKGDVETLVISNPLPGKYKMKVYGLPGKKGVAALQVSGQPAVSVRTTGEASVEEVSVVLTAKAGSRGDVNGDGSINELDLTLLKQKIPLVVGGFANTGDMDGNGQLNEVDVFLLAQYLQLLAPTGAPSGPPTVVDPEKCFSSTDRCSGLFLKRYRMHRMSDSRCVEQCVLRIFVGLRLLRGGWKCGKCK